MKVVIGKCCNYFFLIRNNIIALSGKKRMSSPQYMIDTYKIAKTKLIQYKVPSSQPIFEGELVEIFM